MSRPSISLFQLSTRALSYLSASDTYTAQSLAAAASSPSSVTRGMSEHVQYDFGQGGHTFLLGDFAFCLRVVGHDHRGQDESDAVWQITKYYENASCSGATQVVRILENGKLNSNRFERINDTVQMKPWNAPHPPLEFIPLFPRCQKFRYAIISVEGSLVTELRTRRSHDDFTPQHAHPRPRDDEMHSHPKTLPAVSCGAGTQSECRRDVDIEARSSTEL